ncbi:hypothetical protein C8R11_13021 [Nitrosomonas aestuarii]|nr:hypothetical protein C8R11_13021 [Nitrosomonas aestuarii]
MLVIYIILNETIYRLYRSEDHDSIGCFIFFSQMIGDLLKKIDWLLSAENRLSGRIAINGCAVPDQV